MNTPIGQSTLGEMLPLFISIGILLLIIIFCINMIRVTSKARKVNKQQKAALKAQGLSIYTAFNHVNGLPIAENLLCEVFSFPNRIEFKAGTTDITLSRENITDMCVKTDVEIQQQYVSSIGGAIGGAVLFGPLGAMIGGRAQKKTDKTRHTYLIITYTGDQDELKYIGLDATANTAAATKLVVEFHKLNQNTGVRIQL